MKVTYLNNVNYGYIKIECSFIRINMATYKSINAFMKYDMDLFERVLWKINTFLALRLILLQFVIQISDLLTPFRVHFL